MAEPPRYPDTGTPRWVKVAGIIALVLVLLFVVLLLFGKGGGHGPGRHTSGSDGSGGHTGLPASISHTQP
jgi:hypothetical protein